MRRSALLLAAVTATLLASGAAMAITYGKPDGNRPPNVGALVARFGAQKDTFCSGTPISPAHCTAFAESRDDSRVWVSFDPTFAPDASPLVRGTTRTNPAYPGPTSDTRDIAVVALARPVTGVEPASLPTASLLDRLTQNNGLRDQRFTAVGYGVQERTTGGGQPTFGESGARLYSTSTFNALNETLPRLSQNPATGDGGTCFGDSGGPNFLGSSETIASITITGDAVRRATNTAYRLDTPSARAFLDDHVTLP